MKKIPTAPLSHLLTFGLLLFLTSPMIAADQPQPDRPEALSHYRSGEFNVDLFTTYTVPERNIDRVLDTNARHGKFGLGAGVSYFLTENFGVGADATLADYNNIESDVVEHASLSAIARLPLGDFAPSVFAGAGRNLAEGEYDLHAGAGIEWRLTASAGVFVDGRYLFASHTAGDSAIARLGLRLSF